MQHVPASLPLSEFPLARLSSQVLVRSYLNSIANLPSTGNFCECGQLHRQRCLLPPSLSTLVNVMADAVTSSQSFFVGIHTTFALRAPVCPRWRPPCVISSSMANPRAGFVERFPRLFANGGLTRFATTGTWTHGLATLQRLLRSTKT